MTAKSHSLFLTTCSSDGEAKRIAKMLLKARLVACVNILPKIRSHYWWKGKIESSKEWLLIMKSQTILQPKLEAAIKNNHSYSVPELLRFDVDGGLPAYLHWIDASLAEEPKE